jgi:hypothetical protein
VVQGKAELDSVIIIKEAAGSSKASESTITGLRENLKKKKTLFEQQP